MYMRLRELSERMMPVLFVGSLILLGMSAGQHNTKNLTMFAISVFGTLPNFHKDSWRALLCPPSREASVAK